MTSVPTDFDIPKQYIDKEGRIIQWPKRKKRKLQLNILRFMAHQFELDRIYTEREVNDVLKAHHTFEDWALLRRELYELGWMTRELNGTEYRRVAKTLEDMTDRNISVQCQEKNRLWVCFPHDNYNISDLIITYTGSTLIDI